MIEFRPGVAGGTPPQTGEAERLRKAAHDFEGVFIAQLFREMRATVPAEDGGSDGGMYTALLDDALANEAAGRSTRGLGEALYRQLAQRLTMEHPAPKDLGNGNGGR
ncbi:MAG: rod-binding protein [Gemmatimonadales bacterium]